MNFNIPATPHKGIVHKQETGTICFEESTEEIPEWHRNIHSRPDYQSQYKRCQILWKNQIGCTARY